MLRLAVSLLLVFALFSSAAHAKNYRLNINTEPKNARITIWNIKAAFKQGMSLPAGTYDIQVSQAGYHSVRQKIRISANKRLSIRLKPKTQQLYVTTEPAKATVRVLSVLPKYRPGMALSAGSHEILVSHPGYRSWRKRITVKDQDFRLHVALSPLAANTPQPSTPLQPNTGVYNVPSQPTFYITTNPANASIYMVNLNRYYTPGMELPLGRYEVEISAPDYASQRQWIDVSYLGGNQHIVLSRHPGCYAGRFSVSGSRYDELDYWVKLSFTGHQVSGTYSRLRVSDNLQIENMHFSGVQRDNMLDVTGATERNGQLFQEQRNFYLQDGQFKLNVGNTWIALPRTACPAN